MNDADDNDCDGLVDEGTEGADDDGDSFSELDGDCDDAIAFWAEPAWWMSLVVTLLCLRCRC